MKWPAQNSQTGQPMENSYRVLKQVLMDGSAISKAGVSFDEALIDENQVLRTVNSGRRNLYLELTPEGDKQLAALTATNIGRQLAIVFGDKLLNVPIINSTIPHGPLPIHGQFTEVEVFEILSQLNADRRERSFSPVFERSLPRQPENHGVSVLLNLDSGITLTNTSFTTSDRSSQDWVRMNGAHLMAIGGATNAPVLQGFDLVSAKAYDDSWDSLRPQDVIWNWTLMREAPQQDARFAGKRTQAINYLFRTRNDSYGILQILPANGPSTNVNLRYKLVQEQKR